VVLAIPTIITPIQMEPTTVPEVFVITTIIVTITTVTITITTEMAKDSRKPIIRKEISAEVIMKGAATTITTTAMIAVTSKMIMGLASTTTTISQEPKAEINKPPILNKRQPSEPIKEQKKKKIKNKH